MGYPWYSNKVVLFVATNQLASILTDENWETKAERFRVHYIHAGSAYNVSHVNPIILAGKLEKLIASKTFCEELISDLQQCIQKLLTFEYQPVYEIELIPVQSEYDGKFIYMIEKPSQYRSDKT